MIHALPGVVMGFSYYRKSIGLFYLCLVLTAGTLMLLLPAPGTLAQSDGDIVDQQSSKQAAEQPAPQELPDPDKVYFYIFMLDIDDINGATQSFIGNLFMRLRWTDKRLVHEGPNPKRVPLDSVWNPRAIITNPKGLVRKSLEDVVEIQPDGSVVYYQHFVGTLGQPLELQDFPMDRHTFTIQFSAIGSENAKVEFIPDKIEGAYTMAGGDISSTLSLPDWQIIEYHGAAIPFEPIATVTAPGFAFQFTARRRALYYLFQIIIPLAVVVAMSWAAFWIDPSLAGSQIGVATSSILSLIAYRFVLSGVLPRLPYMTRLDYLLFGSTILVFLALVEVIITNLLTSHDYKKATLIIDWVSRIAFPTSFVILFYWSLFW